MNNIAQIIAKFILERKMTRLKISMAKFWENFFTKTGKSIRIFGKSSERAEINAVLNLINYIRFISGTCPTTPPECSIFIEMEEVVSAFFMFTKFVIDFIVSVTGCFY